MPSACFQRPAVARHAGAAHHDGVGAVLVLERAADLDHLRQRSFAGRRLRDGHVRAAARRPGDPSGPSAGDSGCGARIERCAIAITPKRSARASAVSTPHSAMPNTGRVGRLAADMQAGIAVAGDDEGGRLVVAFDEPAQRHRHALDIGLALDPEGPFGQRLADDLRSARRSRAACKASLEPLRHELRWSSG